jgi:hypothetical protein
LNFAAFDESFSPFDVFAVNFGSFSTNITGDLPGFFTGTYTSESYVIPGADITSTTTTLSFQLSSSNNDWHLDDVSLTPVNTTGVPGPVAGTGLPGIIAGSIGLFVWLRRHRKTSLIAAHWSTSRSL